MWQLDPPIATLTSGPLQLRVNYARPGDGLFDIQIEGQSLPGARLLQVRTPHHAPAEGEEAVTEVYTRGPDLVATYEQTNERTVRPQVYWRAIRLAAPGGDIYGIDLIVSMQTNLLDSEPGMTIQSDVGAAEAWQFSDASADSFHRVSSSSAARVDRGDTNDLVVARPMRRTFSYAEMVYPSDFAGGTVSWSEDETSLGISTRIFDQRLEKGVIRRGRLRGVFLPRADDVQLASLSYSDLSLSSPPLTT